jgi:ppGpp synthetase/RelA/SpoT-type nucleotidyltranferase
MAKRLPKANPKLSKEEKLLIPKLVQYYQDNKGDLEAFLEGFAGQILSSKLLKDHMHSVKWRMKDPDHLREKLERKILGGKEEGKPYRVTTKNLFWKVSDLAGLRILHLYTQQADDINRGLQAIFEEELFTVVEGPTARTWDDESRDFFKKVNIKTMKSPSLYTSVHYVIKPRKKTKYTCEIQVRTLMEEVWGEVNHSLNYPQETKSLACREQIAALARTTSASTRLVDSIFRSHADYKKNQGK